MALLAKQGEIFGTWPVAKWLTEASLGSIMGASERPLVAQNSK